MTPAGRRFGDWKSLALVVALLAAPAWGCVESGTDPTPDDEIPQVAGNYAGTITLAFPENGTSMTCTATTSATQSGSTVNMTPIVLGGLCDGINIPIGTVIIDDTGDIPASVSGTTNNPDCGTYNYTVTGGFDGTELQLSATLTSTTCDDATLTVVLIRS
ncbi:MAG: hypothetical protein AB7P22_01640 [Vicinamibacterales bacterium]